MKQTLRHQQLLRCSLLYPRRRMTTAGRFWTAYAIGALLGVYVLVDIVTRAL
jgi:hypothetical protein